MDFIYAEGARDGSADWPNDSPNCLEFSMVMGLVVYGIVSTVSLRQFSIKKVFVCPSLRCVLYVFNINYSGFNSYAA